MLEAGFGDIWTSQFSVLLEARIRMFFLIQERKVELKRNSELYELKLINIFLYIQ